MTGLATTIPTGITAFVVTNLDDLVLLTLFFSQVNETFRRRHIVLGQYLGFCTLLLISFPGFLGGALLPRHWIGLLGLVPIAIGLSQFLNADNNSPEENSSRPESSVSSKRGSLFSPQTYGVAAITIANGTDNIGIYVPLFATCSLERLLIIISTFLLLVGVWCYTTYKLTRQPAIANILARTGNTFVPFVLIGLGAFIVLESRALTPIALAASALCLAGLVKNYGKYSDTEPSLNSNVNYVCETGAEGGSES